MMRMFEWTPEDETYVKQLFEAGRSATQIAKVTGRTVNSVANKLTRLCGTSTHNPVKKWTPEEKQALVNMRGSHSWEQIAETFGTSITAAKSMLRDGCKSIGVTTVIRRAESGRPSAVPPEVMADCIRRQMTPPRDLTAIFCGDPKPGFSALERRA